jgi:PIN domain nuclease of toxin-antitoxin system
VKSAPLLDTHAWVWWVHGDERLGRGALRELDDLPLNDRPAIADISLWEVATLVSRGRLELEMPFSNWLELAASSQTVRILPISRPIALEVSGLGDTIHRDPADRLIIATSRVHGVPLLTRDEAISKSGLVKLWKPKIEEHDYAGRLPRLFELRAALREPGHADAYFQNFEERLRNHHIFDQYHKLERYLDALNEPAWQSLKRRAIDKLIARQRDEGRGWQDVFDVLNEAVAYGFLLSRGATHIQFLGTGKTKTPDIAARLHDTTVLCEVKTVNKTAEQARRDQRGAKGEIFVTEAITALSDQWLAKLADKIAEARRQLAHSPTDRVARIVFVAINFDDRIGDYHDRYFMQIDRFLDSIDLKEVELVLYPTTNAFGRQYVMRNATVYLG